MDRKYQVFVSSTFEDLIEERQEVLRALLELDCIPSAMEFFPAAAEDQWSLIKRTIDYCDYYVVIVGGKYGSIAPSGISYTQLEFEYALSLGKPVIAFLNRDPSSLPVSKTELDSERRRLLDVFRSALLQRLCKTWSNPAELGAVVSRSLARLIQDRPGVGWVRADMIPDENANQMIGSLQSRVAELERAITHYSKVDEALSTSRVIRSYAQPVLLAGPRAVGKTSLLMHWHSPWQRTGPLATAVRVTAEVPVMSIDQPTKEPHFANPLILVPVELHLFLRVSDFPGEIHAQSLLRDAIVEETRQSRNELSVDLGVVLVCMFNAEEAHTGISCETREYYSGPLFSALDSLVAEKQVRIGRLLFVFNKMDLLKVHYASASDPELLSLCLERFQHLIMPFRTICTFDSMCFIPSILVQQLGYLKNQGPSVILGEASRELVSHFASTEAGRILHSRPTTIRPDWL